MYLNLSAGLMVGLFSTALFFGLHALGELRSPFGAQAMWTAVAFHALTLVVTLWRHRSRETQIPFPRLLAAGLLITLIAALVGGMGTWIFLQYADPSFLDWIKAQSTEQLAGFDLDEAEKARQLEAVQSSTPASFVTHGIVAVMVRGFFLTRPIAALIRIRAVRRPEDL